MPLYYTQFSQDASDSAWAVRFAPVVSIGSLGGLDLLEPTVSDGAIYSRINAVFPQFFPQFFPNT